MTDFADGFYITEDTKLTGPFETEKAASVYWAFKNHSSAHLGLRHVGLFDQNDLRYEASGDGRAKPRRFTKPSTVIMAKVKDYLSWGW